MIGHDFSRTDPKDALLVASNARRGYFDFYREYSDEVKAMHSLSISYDKLRKNVVACAGNLLRLIMSLVKENRMYEARGNKSVQRLYYLEKKYTILKNRDRIRFAKKVV